MIVDGENAENSVMSCKCLCLMGLGKKKIVLFFLDFFVGEAVKGVKKAKARAGEKEPALRGLPRSREGI